jgi:hypothetical protein
MTVSIPCKITGNGFIDHVTIKSNGKGIIPKAASITNSVKKELNPLARATTKKILEQLQPPKVEERL